MSVCWLKMVGLTTASATLCSSHRFYCCCCCCMCFCGLCCCSCKCCCCCWCCVPVSGCIFVVGFRPFRRPPAFRYSTQLPHASGRATDMCLLVALLLSLLCNCCWCCCCCSCFFFLLFASFVVVGYRVVCIASADLFHSVHHSMHHAVH